MKKAAFMFIVLLLAASGSPLFADPSSGLDQFVSAFQNACASHDFETLKTFYDYDGVPQASIDRTMARWQEYFAPDSPWQLTKVEFITLDEVLADPSTDKARTLSHLHPYNFNGTMYAPNVPVLGYLQLSYHKPQVSATMRIPIGQMPDGTYKVSLVRTLP
jgi:hypothetical protein